MPKSVVLIDGENFLKKIEEICKLESPNTSQADIVNININKLINNVLRKKIVLKQSSINYYSAKLKVYNETKKKSLQLIANQRHLKNSLEKQGINFIIAGNVRMQSISMPQKAKKKYSFKEKGIDVRIAVDMVSIACNKEFDTIILCSSDSDLQPAVKEARRRGVKVVYLGFSINPNKGLMYTCDEFFLLKNQDVIRSIPCKKVL